MSRDTFSRRAFLGVSAVGGGVGLASVVAGASTPPARPDQKTVFGLTTEPLSTVRIGLVGMGARGNGLLGNLLSIEGVEVTAVCDVVPDRVEAAQRRIRERQQTVPAGYSRDETDFENLCAREDVDLVYVVTPWDWHVPMALCAMRHGKHAAIEVPAAVTLDECWQLVDTAEQTQRHCIMLENCCYGEIELLILNMVRQGVFGELTHGEAGYLHEARDFILSDVSATNWRRRFVQEFNGNLYPTHGLGPVAQYLGIHGGDKFDVLVSMSSLERALSVRRDRLPDDDPRRAERFACGDVNTSLLRTALGRTVMVQYSMALSRPYSRINMICGTQGTFCDYPPRIHLDGHADQWDTDMTPYLRQYGHPLWNKLSEQARRSGGHGGMDFVMNWRLIDCLRRGLPLDMTVYDAAAWSSVFPLSVASVAFGSAPVQIPDFTRGEWIRQSPIGIVEVT